MLGALRGRPLPRLGALAGVEVLIMIVLSLSFLASRSGSSSLASTSSLSGT
jgi:hypothetical protein